MKLFALALDYDGTIARNNTVSADVRAAIATARASGLLVLLVTGRILDELRRVAGDLRFVDGVVAENGGVLHFTETGHTTTIAPPIPAGFVDELRRVGLPHAVGQTLIDADAIQAPALLQAIRTLEMPLVLIFNGGRVMTMAQGSSKATGLQAMLNTLRRSPHNMVAIGDAENDHAMLRLAEVGAAVEWGSMALRAAADVVVPGQGPSAVADYVRELTAAGTLPLPARARRRLRLGYTQNGREFSLAVRGRNVLVAGDAKSGKSWVAGLLCEQLILHGYSVCVIDPEGDYRSLEGLTGVTVLGGEDPPPSPRELVRALRYPDRSIIIDLSRQQLDTKVGYIRNTLPLLNALRQQIGLPHRIVVDEAHYFLDGGTMQELGELQSHGYTFVTYRASSLPQALLHSSEVVIVTRESDPIEIDALRNWCSTCRQVDPSRWAILRGLPTAQAVALPITEECGGDLVLFTLGPRITPHVRHREKYVDVPISEPRAFVFSPNGRHTPRRARTLRQFVAELEHDDDWDGYLRRGDFSRWIADVFGDRVLADQLRAIETEYRATPQPGTAGAIVSAIRERYDLSHP